MEGRNGDAPETGESGSSSTSSTETTALKAWLPENWVPDEWPSGRRLSHWRERTPRTGRKTASALALVALLAAIGIGGYYWYQGVQEQRRQERLQKIAEKVSDPVYWPSNRVTTLDAKFQLSTKWLPDQTTNGSASYKNGELKHKLNIRGYPTGQSHLKQQAVKFRGDAFLNQPSDCDVESTARRQFRRDRGFEMFAQHPVSD